MKGKYVIRCLAGSFAISVLALWTADVIVNLELLQEILLGHGVQGRALDFLSLGLAETQAALAVVLLGSVGGIVVGKMFAARSITDETRLLQAATLFALMVLVGTRVAWQFSGPRIKASIVIAAAAGAAWWVVLRIHAGARKRNPTSIDTLLQGVYPMLVFGFFDIGFSQLLHHQGGRTTFNFIAGAVTLVAWAMMLSRVSLLRRILKWLPVGAACGVAVYTSIVTGGYGRVAEGGSRDRSDRPDIILIVLDTVRADHLKRYGYPRNTMPALEEWAGKALVFERAVSPAGWTTPAHASIFSGLPVSLHGIHYASRSRAFYTPARDGIEWLPEVLGREGYTCRAVVSNHYAIPLGMKGFDTVLDPRRIYWRSSSIGACVDHFSPLLQRISERLSWRMPYVQASDLVNITMRSVPESRPLFLFVNLMDAHSPYNPPEGALRALGLSPRHIFSRYRSHRELTRLWKSLPEDKSEVMNALYDGELRGMDQALARLFGWIERRFGEGAIVIVTSDHGEELGEEGRVGHEYGLAQRLIHVPLFIRGAGIEPGVVRRPVSLRNLYDFIIAASRGGRTVSGGSLEPDDFGILSERYPSRYQISMWGQMYNRAWVSLIEGPYKAMGPSENGFQLFRFEDEDFDVETPTTIDSLGLLLQERMDAYWNRYGDRREEKEDFGAPSEEELKRLRSLGYVD